MGGQSSYQASAHNMLSVRAIGEGDVNMPYSLLQDILITLGTHNINMYGKVLPGSSGKSPREGKVKLQRDGCANWRISLENQPSSWQSDANAVTTAQKHAMRLWWILDTYHKAKCCVHPKNKIFVTGSSRFQGEH